MKTEVSPRTGENSRKTRETQIQIKLNIDGQGRYEINSGIGFFNHMMEAFSKHSLIDMRLDASGDIHVDYHHLVEDTGITLGQTVQKILGDKRGIRRFGHSVVPLDEALVEAAVDISGRPGCYTNFRDYPGHAGEFHTELGDVFFQGFASAGYTVHLNIQRGENSHHILEAAFKAFAKALRMAVEIDERIASDIPSTKDFLA